MIIPTDYPPAYNQYAIIGSIYCDPNDTDVLYRDAKWDEPGDVEFLRSLHEVS